MAQLYLNSLPRVKFFVLRLKNSAQFKQLISEVPMETFYLRCNEKRTETSRKRWQTNRQIDGGKMSYYLWQYCAISWCSSSLRNNNTGLALIKWWPQDGKSRQINTFTETNSVGNVNAEERTRLPSRAKTYKSCGLYFPPSDSASANLTAKEKKNHLFCLGNLRLIVSSNLAPGLLK